MELSRVPAAAANFREKWATENDIGGYFPVAPLLI